MTKPIRKSVLHEKNCLAALARFDRDVLSQAGVHHLIMLEGINDIAHATDRVKLYSIITADDLIEAYLQIVTRAHIQGIQVSFGTITPFGVITISRQSAKRCAWPSI